MAARQPPVTNPTWPQPMTETRRSSLPDEVRIILPGISDLEGSVRVFAHLLKHRSGGARLSRGGAEESLYAGVHAVALASARSIFRRKRFSPSSKFPRPTRSSSPPFSTLDSDAPSR